MFTRSCISEYFVRQLHDRFDKVSSLIVSICGFWGSGQDHSGQSNEGVSGAKCITHTCNLVQVCTHCIANSLIDWYGQQAIEAKSESEIKIESEGVEL